MDVYETFVAVKLNRTQYPYSILESEKISETHKTINLELDETAKVYKLEKKRYFEEKMQLIKKGLEQEGKRRIIVVDYY